MKNKGIKTCLTLALVFLFSACSSNAQSKFVRFDDYVPVFDDYKEIVGDGYYKPSSYKAISYLNDDNKIETVNDFNEVFRQKNYAYNLKSTSKQNLLVIPVDFLDSLASSLPEGKLQAKVNIENAFFGASGATTWESVASFYNKSSYGKLIIDGKVSDWFTCQSFTGIQLSSSTARYGTVKQIREEALAWYQSQYDDIANYYIDGDASKGVALYLIYNYPYDTTQDARNKVLWAYTMRQPEPTSWSSYYLCSSGNSISEARTFIHEVGHIFGLDDYYNTTNLTNNDPTGRLDMMDHTIGDHSGYSKMLLNWTRPYVITSNTTLTIRPFSSSGDLILLKNNWNGSPMDEYLLLEFYTPEGLNKNDDSELVSQCGVKVYHVDSRLGFKHLDLSSAILGYINEVKYSKNNYHLSIINNNSDYAYQGHKLYSLLESSGLNTFQNGGYASNITIFKEGSSFGYTAFNNFQFNDGSYVPFNFTIDKVTNTYATISFVSR